MSSHYTTFINGSPLPVVLTTWQPIFGGLLSECKNVIVNPNEKKTLASETGEWSINTYFYDKNICDEWKSAGCGSILGKDIGKFSVHSRFNDKCSCFYDCHNKFRVVYDADEVIFLKIG